MITVKDVVLLVVLLFAAGVLDKFVVPDEYRWFFRAVLAVLFVVWLLVMTGLLNKVIV